MSCVIIKPEKDLDLYVYWASITDSPMTWGTRAEVSKYLAQHQHDNTEARWARTDETGTSARNGSFQWEDSGMVFEGTGFLHRKDLKRFLDSWEEKSDTFDASMLEPPEDNDAILG